MKKRFGARTISPFCMAALLFLFVSVTSAADDIHKKAGTAAAAFLKIDAGSRPMGMGGAFTGLADDINTLFWNPAGLTSIQDQEFSAMQNFSIGKVYTQALSYGQRLNEKSVWGISLQGVFTRVDFRQGPTADPDQEVTVGGFAPGVSWAYQLRPQVAVGLTAKAVVEQLSVENTLGYAGDLGVFLQPFGKTIGLGFSAQNVGQTNSNGSLPMIIRSGVSLHPEESISIVADLSYPLIDGYPILHLGFENWFSDLIAVRLGYNASQGENPRDGLTAGIGLRRRGRISLEGIHFQFDYAIVPDPGLGHAHRIACLMRF